MREPEVRGQKSEVGAQIAEKERLIEECDARESRLSEFADEVIDARDAALDQDMRSIAQTDRDNDRLRRRLCRELDELCSEQARQMGEAS